MFPTINPRQTKAWARLEEHAREMKAVHLRNLFAEDPDRYKKFALCYQDTLFDFSKNLITDKTLELLVELAEECRLNDAIEAMYEGDAINQTEKRSVLHIALRNFSGRPVYQAGQDVMEDVFRVQEQMKNFCREIHSGSWKGYTGKKIRNIVNIGIGGSDLGPYMVTEALKPYWVEGIQTYFVSNVDATHLAETLKKINPEETLFLIASKTFTTQETMTNAHSARDWFLRSAGEEAHIALHFVALSTNEKEVTKFGIDSKNMFAFWDWVGGRYSLWSAIGLSIALTIGYENFESLLRGAHGMDEHFHREPFDRNVPVVMALISLWYVNFFGAQTEAILPYDQYLHRFAAYFQQGNMESNGKSVENLLAMPQGPLSGGSPAPTASMHSTSSFTRVLP